MIVKEMEQTPKEDILYEMSAKMQNAINNLNRVEFLWKWYDQDNTLAFDQKAIGDILSAANELNYRIGDATDRVEAIQAYKECAEGEACKLQPLACELQHQNHKTLKAFIESYDADMSEDKSLL